MNGYVIRVSEYRVSQPQTAPQLPVWGLNRSAVQQAARALLVWPGNGPERQLLPDRSVWARTEAPGALWAVLILTHLRKHNCYRDLNLLDFYI